MGVWEIQRWNRRSTAVRVGDYTARSRLNIPALSTKGIPLSGSGSYTVKCQISLRTKVSRHYFSEIKGGKKSKTGTKNYVNETNGNAISFLWKRPVEKPVEIVEKCEFSTASPANYNSYTREMRSGPQWKRE